MYLDVEAVPRSLGCGYLRADEDLRSTAGSKQLAACVQFETWSFDRARQPSTLEDHTKIMSSLDRRSRIDGFYS